MRLLSIVVLGGSGFLGTRLVARLIKDGHQVTVLSRDRERHKHLLVLPGLTLENCDVYQEAQLSERFRGKDVVINLIGIRNERGFGGAGFRRAHAEMTQHVLKAARSAGVSRLLQVSALKAAPDAPSHYLSSKGEAEKLIREQQTTMDWTILEPSVMFGPGDAFLNRFAGLLAAIPLVFPLARPNARLQPVWVDDVVDALLRCLHGGASSRQTFELGGPQVYTLREILTLVAKLTRRRRWIVGLPNFLGRLQAFFMNFVPGRPFSGDNYRTLGVDSVLSEDGFARLGIHPASMAATARLYLGAQEDNARLSQNRAAAGRAKSSP
ncbi:MAG TPA: complex I NDUFA9 subunit family protein [Steroidobacteraceae bacterium]|jgi:NADH dehydrogenase|nr:complex I NDUFA9 subunit family protein [Steroidobacteraceae bacterium]